ncbi:MAG: hypothetical protein U0640_11445 [Phycisphaerales bacterium]
MTCAQKQSGWSLWLLVGVAMAAWSVFSATNADAQIVSRMSRSGGPAGMVISKRSVDEYADMLGLTAEQKATVKTLHEGYRSAMDAVSEEFDAKEEALQEKVRDTGDATPFQTEIPALMKERMEKSRGLTKQFLDDVKATLSTEQADKWPAIERKRRRETGLSGGFYSGGDVDLVSLARTEKLDMNAPGMKEALEAYETEMDQKLKEIESERSELRKKDNGQAIAIVVTDDGSGPRGSADDRIKKIAEQSKMLRDINERHVQKIAASLPEAERAKFEAAFDRRAFPRIYKPAYASDMLEAAHGMEDLTDEQKQKIAAAKEQYESQIKALNRTWEESQRNAEDVSGMGNMGLMMMGFGGGDKNDDVSKARKALNEARKARKDLDSATEKKLKEILTPDQRDRLPEKRKDDEGDGPGNVRIQIGGGGGAQDDED